MPSYASTDLINDCSVLKLHDMCGRKGFKCQKQSAFPRKQHKLEGASIKSNLKENFWGTEKAWIKFLEPALNIASPFIGMAVAAKTKYLENGKATDINLKSLGGGKILSSTDMHGNGLGLKLM